jgi:hypothetical protein
MHLHITLDENFSRDNCLNLAKINSEIEIN